MVAGARQGTLGSRCLGKDSLQGLRGTGVGRWMQVEHVLVALVCKLVLRRVKSMESRKHSGNQKKGKVDWILESGVISVKQGEAHSRGMA